MMIDRSLPRRVTAAKAWPALRWSFAKGAWLMAGALLAAGCVVAPTQPATTAPASPSVPQTPNGSLPADQQKGASTETGSHATASDRQRFQVRIDFGRVFESQGNLDAAVLEYQEALNVAATRRRGSLGAADEALAHRRMGGALDQMGRFAQAEVHYKKALELSPKDARVWNDVGYSYYLQGRWADAERSLERAAVLAPEDNRVRTNLGLTLAAAGRTAEALPLLSQSNGDAVGHANLGYLLAATGQFDLARSQYESALSMRPDLELARRALAKIALQDHRNESPGAPPAITAQLAPPAPTPPVEASVKPVSTPPVEVPTPAPSTGEGNSLAVTAQLALPAAISAATSVQPPPAPRIDVPTPMSGTLQSEGPPVTARVNWPRTIAEMVRPSAGSVPTIRELPSLPRVEAPVAAPPLAIAQLPQPATPSTKVTAKPAPAPRFQIPTPVPSGSRPAGTASGVTARSSPPAAHHVDASVKPASAPRVQIPPPVPKRLLPQTATGASAGSQTLTAVADAQN
jgi:Flp pilus assembly protein TadD